jgi:hypothetical protein
MRARAACRSFTPVRSSPPARAAKLQSVSSGRLQTCHGNEPSVRWEEERDDTSNSMNRIVLHTSAGRGSTPQFILLRTGTAPESR